MDSIRFRSETAFTLINVKAELRRELIREQYTPFNMRAFLAIYLPGEMWRPTEMEALSNLKRPVNLDTLPRLTRSDIHWVDSQPHKHNQAIGKVCAKCGCRKPFSDFSPDNRMADKHHSYCKACRRRDRKCSRLNNHL